MSTKAGAAPLPFDFENEHKVMSMFTDNAKTYVQLSSGALAFSITFVHEVLGIPKDQPVTLDRWTMASWIAFLVAIGAGSFYQYLAVKYLEKHLPNYSWKDWAWLSPGWV